jgi:ABC-type Fe3+-citrate transport system substrate-binding protein
MMSSVRLLIPCVVIGMAVGQVMAVEPVRMGCGIMTFDTVPGWGLDEQGKSKRTARLDGVDTTQGELAEVMRVIGADPVGPDTAKFETLSPEFLFQANPDVIIVAGEAKSFLADTRFANLDAVKNLRIFGNNQDMWVRRGGRIDNLIEQAHKALMLVIKK